MEQLNKEAIENFQEYLRIPSVHPDVDYCDCLKFIKRQADSLNLKMRTYMMKPNKPVVVLTWKGKNPELPSILLNSHMDVVPVFEEKWTKKPFGAEIIDGKIYARGAQDMKCVPIQYLEAIKRLQRQNIFPKRTVHISFVPDEEIGGLDGMGAFVQTKEFEELNIGMALDEGLPCPEDMYYLTYAERTSYALHIKCKGTSGHGSVFLKNTAGEKMSVVLNKIYEYRREMENLIEEKHMWYGDVTTLNLTVLKGGVQENVVPAEFEAVVDCRVSVAQDLEKFEEMLKEWCEAAGDGVSIQCHNKYKLVPPTKLDNSNIYWEAFQKAADELSLVIEPLVMPARTDGNFIRELGIPVFGFSPMANTKTTIHDHDEFLDISTFLNGIDIYVKIIISLANA